MTQTEINAGDRVELLTGKRAGEVVTVIGSYIAQNGKLYVLVPGTGHRRSATAVRKV